MAQKYVKCGYCEKKIYMGDHAFAHQGYVKIFCSLECFVRYGYCPELKTFSLSEDFAESHEAEIYED